MQEHGREAHAGEVLTWQYQQDIYSHDCQGYFQISEVSSDI